MRVAAVITEPGVVAGMSDEEYHGDPVHGGSLSYTGMKAILRAPARYHHDRGVRVDKPAFDAGHVVHAKVLGTGAEYVEIPERLLASNGAASTKDAKRFVAEARLAGQVPLKASVLAPLEAVAEAVLAHPLARALLERPGVSEASAFAPDPVTGVWLRVRVDRLPDPGEGRTICVDVKTSRSAYPPDFRRQAAELGYDIQRALYPWVVSMARGDEDPAFVFVVVEHDPPHLVSVVEMGPDFEAVGRSRVCRAIDTYHRCRESGTWPGYAPVVHTVEPPLWLTLAEEEMQS